MGKVCAKADERDDDDDATHGRRCGCRGHLGSGRSVGLDRVESGGLKIKLARGTTATATVLRLAERVSRGRHAISELRTCSTAQIRFSFLPPSLSLLLSSLFLPFPPSVSACVFSGSTQFQRKPKVVSYTSPVRPRLRPRRPHPPFLVRRTVRPLRPPANPTWCALMTFPSSHNATEAKGVRRVQKTGII